MIPDPNARNLTDALAAGAATRAGWLFGQLATQGDRIDAIVAMFPNMDPTYIPFLLRDLQTAWEAGQQLQAGFGLPTEANIPVNPDVSTPGTDRVDVVISLPNPNDPERPVTNRVTVDLPAGLTGDDLYAALDDALDAQAYATAGKYEVGFDELDTDESGRPVYSTVILGVTRS